MNALQNKMLELLGEIDEICKKHNIQYCLFAGSGLGADRHNGFIPWDDDADIIMTLENYEKFLNVFDKEALEGKVLNCLERDINYPFTYARYVDVNTTAIQRHTAFGGCDPGIKIDIFVAVPTHYNVKKAEMHRLEILAFSEVICPYSIMHTFRPEGFVEAYNKEKKLYNRLGREKYIKKRMRKLMKYQKPGTGKYILFSGMLCNSYIFDSELLDEVKYVDFENKMLPISEHNVRLTKALYGESWISKPPHVEKAHHVYLLDMDRPYKEYIDILWDEYDFDIAEQTAADRRKLHMTDRDEFKDVIINNQQLRNLAVEIGTRNAFGLTSDEKRTDCKYMYKLFREYYTTQLKNINKVYKLLIDLGPKELEAAINASVMMGKYYEIADIISTFGDKGHFVALSDEIKGRVTICRDITETLCIDKDFGKLRIMLDYINDEVLKESLTVKIAELWSQVIKSESMQLMNICEKVDEYCEQYGHIGELLIIKGYCLENMGNIDEAAAVYKLAANNICNGFMYQWLSDKGYDTYEYSYE